MSEPQRNAGPDSEEPQQESLFSRMKYFIILYFLFNVGINFINRSDPSTVAPQTQPTTTTTTPQTIKLVPNLHNSTYVAIEKPDVSHKTIKQLADIEDGEPVVELKTVKTAQQIIYENSIEHPQYLTPLYDNEDSYDLKFYISDEKLFVRGKNSPVLKLDDVKLNSRHNTLKSLKLSVPDHVRFHNGSLYLHTFINKHGDDLEGYKSIQLNTYMQKKKQVKLHKLIGGDDVETVKGPKEDVDDQPIVAYWHPNVTISVAKTNGIQDLRTIPPPLRSIFILDPLNRRDNATGLVSRYYPIVYENKFWQLKDHMYEINSTITQLDLNLNIEFVAYWKIQVLSIFSDGMKQQQEQLGGLSGGLSDGSEVDSLKRILLDTNPYLLAITVFVSLLHSILEMLAFKNDISHWKNKKNNVGVSVRSIVANVVQQIITLAYLIDNSDGTSFMILASQGFGILVEAWKITTIVNIEFVWDSAIPKLKITDKYKLSETEEKTKEYDSIAFKYLYMVTAPLLLAYAIYSLYYKEYKSWYSFIVATLVGFVYTYGFLTLVPSVYINYRLKSVAHVPRRAMAYKVVNTFIDDLFAFVIKMPWLHRLATLRDDVIFFIYLYQTWIYRVDYSRINEFGQGGDGQDEEDVKEDETDKTTETKKDK